MSRKTIGGEHQQVDVNLLNARLCNELQDSNTKLEESNSKLEEAKREIAKLEELNSQLQLELKKTKQTLLLQDMSIVTLQTLAENLNLYIFLA